MSTSPIRTDPPDPEIVPMLISISKLIRALHGMKLAELGLYNGQDELLLAASQTGATVTAIADHLAIRPSTVSKMMDRLVTRGLMERGGDAQDGRRTILRITEAGIEARRQLIVARQELEQELTRTFGEELMPSMAASLTQCQTHLSNRFKRLR